MKAHLTRHAKLLGAYVPIGLFSGIQRWIDQDPERDISVFIRQAAREKLRRDGIDFEEATKAK